MRNHRRRLLPLLAVLAVLVLAMRPLPLLREKTPQRNQAAR